MDAIKLAGGRGHYEHKEVQDFMNATKIDFD